VTDTVVPTSPAGNPIGFGRMLRKEDVRFVRGKGRYVDDIQLPNMLHGAILRSPYAHARIVSIDTSAALAHPNVHAVITGETLATAYEVSSNVDHPGTTLSVGDGEQAVVAVARA
jgi:carbon-monoxide dehydrogenase large subunit